MGIIVDDLVEKLYYHSYLISREEARDLGLKVKNVSQSVEKLIWDLYSLYEIEMNLGKSFNPADYSQGKETEISIALIESLNLRSKFSKRISVGQVSVPPQPGMPPGPQFSIKEQGVGWVTERIKEE